MREQGAIDNAMYRELNRVDPLSASQTLRRLRDAGLLEQKGRGAATYYVPTPYLLASAASLVDKMTGEGLSPKPDEREYLLQALPEPLRQRVLALGRRSPPAAVEQTLLALCAWQPQRTDTLATLLGRRRDTIGDYVARLMRDGRLQPTRPEHARHPQQAYRAAEDVRGAGE